MARFQNTAPYAGKGQKDLADRAASLAALGISLTERNADHPQLLSRGPIVQAEQRLGLTWISGQCSATLRRGHARRLPSGWEQVTASDGITGFCRLIDL